MPKQFFLLSFVALLSATTPAVVSAVAVEHVSLRLPGALIAGKGSDYMRNATLEFDIVDGRPTRAVIHHKPGWHVAGWSGRVDAIDWKTHSEAFSASITATIIGNTAKGGEYRFVIEGSNVSGQLEGEFTSTLGDATQRGTVRGEMMQGLAKSRDFDNSLFTLSLAGGMPRGEVLNVYLDRAAGQWRGAFAFCPPFSRRPYDIDTSGLKLSEERITGTILATRQPKDETLPRIIVGEYYVDLTYDIARGQFRGKHRGITHNVATQGKDFTGTTEMVGDAWAVAGERPEAADPARIFIKIEDGLSGGADWQNRAFFTFTAVDGKATEGKLDNNKNVWKGRFDDAHVKITNGKFTGTLRGTIIEGVLTPGQYTVELDGHNIGGVLCGRFITQLAGKTVNRGYFVGNLSPTDRAPE